MPYGSDPTTPQIKGLLQPGNIDLGKRPVVKNPDGSVSTVRSMSFGENGREILIPTVSDDGRILSNDDAVKLYRQSGKHLGMFQTPDAATSYAQQLHQDQAKQYAPSGGYGNDPTAPPQSAAPRPPLGSEKGTWLSALFSGIGHGAEMAGRGVTQLAESMPTLTPLGERGRQRMLADTSQMIEQRKKAYEQSPQTRAHPIASGIGNFAGEALATSPLMMVPGAAALRMASPAARIGAGIAGGAMGGATQPVGGGAIGGDYWDHKLKQIGLGGAVGGAIPAVGGMISPRLPSVDQVAQGVSRAFRPLMSFFTGAEERTVPGFGRTIARQVLEPVGGTVTGKIAGHDLVKHVEETISDAYDRALPGVQLTLQDALKGSPELNKRIRELSPDDWNTYWNIVSDRLIDRFPPSGAPLDGPGFKLAQSEIGGRAASFVGTNRNHLGQTLLLTAGHLGDVLAETNPGARDALKNANNAWKMYVRMRQAADGATSRGMFTPDDLLRAVRGQDISAAGFAKGDLPLQGYAEAALDAIGKPGATPAQLLHVFTRHGLPAELIARNVGSLGRGMKASTPWSSPIAGETAARQLPEPTIAKRLQAGHRVADIQENLMRAKKVNDLDKVRDLMKELSAAQAERQRLEPRQISP